MAEGAEAISFNAIQFILSNGTRNYENCKAFAMFNVKITKIILFSFGARSCR